MMIACCVPMLLIAVALVLTGAVSADFLIIAVVCTAMMALMHGSVGGEHAQHTGDTSSEPDRHGHDHRAAR